MSSERAEFNNEQSILVFPLSSLFIPLVHLRPVYITLKPPPPGGGGIIIHQGKENSNDVTFFKKIKKKLRKKGERFIK